MTKMRVILDLDQQSAERLERLKNNMGLKTNTVTVRQALALLKAATEKKKDGWDMQFTNGEKTIEVIMP